MHYRNGLLIGRVLLLPHVRGSSLEHNSQCSPLLEHHSGPRSRSLTDYAPRCLSVGPRYLCRTGTGQYHLRRYLHSQPRPVLTASRKFCHGRTAAGPTRLSRVMSTKHSHHGARALGICSASEKQETMPRSDCVVHDPPHHSSLFLPIRLCHVKVLTRH